MPGRTPTLPYFRFSLVLALAMLAACTPYKPLLRAMKRQQITVTPKVLEAQGDQVPFQVTVRVPAKKILQYEQKLTYKVEVSYQYNERSAETRSDYIGGLQFAFGDYQYDAEDKNWLVASKAFAFPYAPEKHPGHVTTRGVVTRNGFDARVHRRNAPKFQVVAPGIISTARLVISRPRLDFTPETYKPTPDSGFTQLPIYFPPGFAVFNAEFGTNAAQLEDFIKENLKTTSIEIVGSNSPEEVERRQPHLADVRGRSVKKWSGMLLDRYGYQNSSASVKFSLKARPRDWTELLNRVQNSALPEAQIEQVLDVVNGAGSYNAKAEKLEKLPCAEYLETYVYPMMRYALVTIKHAPRPLRPDYELYLLAKRIADGTEDPDALTEEELRYAASLTPLLEDKRRIYEGALKTGLSWPACHNLGLIYLLMGEKELTPRIRAILLKKAVKNLTYAAHRNPTNAELWYHLATAQQRLGNVLEGLHAYDYAAKATGAPDLMRQIFADKGALELVAGQPDDALASMQYAEHTYQTVVNTGLAHLLRGDYEQAARYYEEALTMQPADKGRLATYCRAITAARAHDDTALSLWLPRAVALDPTAANRAAQDLEFRDYVNTDLFREALKNAL